MIRRPLVRVDELTTEAEEEVELDGPLSLVQEEAEEEEVDEEEEDADEEAVAEALTAEV